MTRFWNWQKKLADFQIDKTGTQSGVHASAVVTRQELTLSTVISNTPDIRTKLAAPGTLFKWTGVIWYCVTAFGQAAFIAFILGFYGPPSLTGNFQNWDLKDNIHGHIEGDMVGNLAFISHVLLAAFITASGLLQLIPQVRKRAPRIHRLNGRAFLTLSIIAALGGIGLTWVRGSQIAIDSAIGVTLNGVLILVCAAIAWRTAMARQFARHRVWALRTFMVVSGVWFFRVMIMAWSLIGNGALGLSSSWTAIMFPIMSFASYLVPLLILEIYVRAEHSSLNWFRISAIILTLFATLIMAIGIFGTIMYMWLPVL